jgi:hypothetical protein
MSQPSHKKMRFWATKMATEEMEAEMKAGNAASEAREWQHTEEVRGDPNAPDMKLTITKQGPTSNPTGTHTVRTYGNKQDWENMPQANARTMEIGTRTWGRGVCLKFTRETPGVDPTPEDIAFFKNMPAVRQMIAEMGRVKMTIVDPYREHLDPRLTQNSGNVSHPTPSSSSLELN